MTEITHLDISKVLNASLEKGLSAQTTKHIYSVLNKIFSDARDSFGVIEKSPVKPSIHRPSVYSKERNFLEPLEAKDFLLFAEKNDVLFSLAIWIQIFCGLRVGEVQGLKWEDVDFRGHSLLIRRTWNHKTKEFQDYTKNKTQIRVPLPEPLLEQLMKRKKSPEVFICENKSGGHMSRESYAGALRRLCKQSRIKVLTSHELRHTCSELWVSCGASAEDIRRLFNHKSLNSTKTYIHRTDYRLQNLSKKVNPFLIAA